MALTDKKTSQFYKDLIHLNNGNSGAHTNATYLQDGNGTDTILAIGRNKLYAKPFVDTNSAVKFVNTADEVYFTADSDDKRIFIGETQSIANTQYLRFGAKDIDVDNGTHIGVPIAGMGANAVVTFGTSGNPEVPTQTVTADDWIHYIHYVDTNITVDAVEILAGATTATGDNLNFHLCSLATGDTTVVDEWSGITVVADQNVIMGNVGYEQFHRESLDIQSADVDAGSYLALTIEGNGTNSDYSVNALVRYHLR